MFARFLMYCVFLALGLSSAHAGVILSPVSATATSTNFLNVDAQGKSLYDIEYAINQGGLLTNFDSGITDFDAYMATNPMHDYLPESQEWFGARKGFGSGNIVVFPRDTLVFDLGDVYELDRFALWNEENGGIRSASISISSDNVNFTDVLSIQPAGNPFDPDISYQPDIYNYGAGIYSFSGLVSAQYLKFDLVCPNNNSVYAGCSLGEIAFSVAANNTSASVPEPGSFAMMGLGLMGMLGVARRRRQAD